MAYDKDYEKTYSPKHRQVYLKVRNETLVKIINDTFGDNVPLRVLEIACGTGLSLEYLSQLSVKHSLFGIDRSMAMLREAGKKTTRLDNSFFLLCSSGYQLPFADETFDVAFATRFIHILSHDGKKQLYNELTRVVRSGGIIILEFYARPPYWFQSYFSDKTGKSKEEFFKHYPTKREVREIIRVPVRRWPIRLAGSRLFYWAFGERLLRRLTNAAKYWPISLLTDEYLVVTRR